MKLYKVRFGIFNIIRNKQRKKININNLHQKKKDQQQQCEIFRVVVHKRLLISQKDKKNNTF